MALPPRHIKHALVPLATVSASRCVEGSEPIRNHDTPLITARARVTAPGQSADVPHTLVRMHRARASPSIHGFCVRRIEPGLLNA